MHCVGGHNSKYPYREITVVFAVADVIVQRRRVAYKLHINARDRTHQLSARLKTRAHQKLMIAKPGREALACVCVFVKTCIFIEKPHNMCIQRENQSIRINPFVARLRINPLFARKYCGCRVRNKL